MVIQHYEAPCSPELIPLRGVIAFSQWASLHVSKISFCHGLLFAMAPMAVVTPFHHGSHGIFPCQDCQNGKEKEPGFNTNNG